MIAARPYGFHTNWPPRVAVRPTSCGCGGSNAFFVYERTYGPTRALGCVCHTRVAIVPELGGWRVEVERTGEEA